MGVGSVGAVCRGSAEASVFVCAGEFRLVVAVADKLDGAPVAPGRVFHPTTAMAPMKDSHSTVVVFILHRPSDTLEDANVRTAPVKTLDRQSPTRDPAWPFVFVRV